MLICDLHSLSCALLSTAQVLPSGVGRVDHLAEEGEETNVFFIITFLPYLKGIYVLFSKMENIFFKN